MSDNEDQSEKVELTVNLQLLFVTTIEMLVCLHTCVCARTCVFTCLCTCVCWWEFTRWTSPRNKTVQRDVTQHSLSDFDVCRFCRSNFRRTPDSHCLVGRGLETKRSPFFGGGLLRTQGRIECGREGKDPPSQDSGGTEGIGEKRDFKRRTSTVKGPPPIH